MAHENEKSKSNDSGSYWDGLDFIPYGLAPFAAFGLGMVASDITSLGNTSNPVQRHVSQILNHLPETERVMEKLLRKHGDTYYYPVFSLRAEHAGAKIQIGRQNDGKIKARIIDKDGKELPIDYKIILDSLRIVEKQSIKNI